MVEEIKEQVQAFCQLRFTEDELEYLDNITWIKGTYVDFLRLWQPRYEEFNHHNRCTVWLAIDAAGTWLNTSMYEIPVLAIVNEVYFRMAYDYDVLLKTVLSAGLMRRCVCSRRIHTGLAISVNLD